MMPLFCVFLFITGAILGELITLQKGGNVTCVLTEEHTNSAVYLKPFSTKGVVPQRINVSWAVNDWTQTDSSVHHFKPISDSRWNDLQEFDVESYRPAKKKFDLNLSVCAVDSNFTFTIAVRGNSNTKWHEANFTVPVPRDKSEKCSWVHFTMCNKHDSIALIGKSFEDIRSDLNADSWFIFSRFPNYLIKRHLYKFLWSDIISTTPSTLDIHFFTTGEVCVHFYVSIYQGCELEINLKADNEIIYTNRIIGFNIPDELRSWKYVKIEERFEGNSTNGTLFLFRQKTAFTPGYWAIDAISYCQNTTAIYTATLESSRDQATCEILQPSDQVRSNGRFPNQTKVGCLGGNECKIRCEDVLGPSYIYCEGHKICGNYREDKCYCAWGYKGDLCNEECTNGTWGMNCLYQCHEHCNSQCDSRNGTCNDTVAKSIWPSTNLHSTTGNSEMSTTTSINYVPTLETTEVTRIIEPESTSITSTLSSAHLETTLPSITSIMDKSIAQENVFPSIAYVLLILGLLMLFLFMLSLIFRHYLNRKMNRTPEAEVPDLGQSNVGISNFNHYIKRSLAEGFLVNQFNALVNDTTIERGTALEPTNVQKNHDRNNIPYDKNRVVLKAMENVGTGDYINASYIDGWGRIKAYIVTQGPKSITIPDFWRMVWQDDVKTIMMLSNFRENMKREFVEYFPLYLNAVLTFGELSIKLIKEECNEYYTKRILEVYYQRYHKVVIHYHLNWKPEHRKPLYPNDLVPLVQIMNENYEKEDWSPVLVHCSLGIGRSAILILCDIAFQMAKTEGYVDVYYLAKMLREQRPNMITSSQDYILAHLVISECLMAQVPIFHPNINQSNSLSINRQLEYLNTWKWHDDNINILSSHEQRLNDPYVEFLDPYGARVDYYYAKLPQKKSIQSFWRTVLNKKIKMIVFLNESTFKPSLFRLELTERTICAADHVSSFQNSYSVLSKMFIKEKDVRTTTLYEAEIAFLQLLGWKSKGCKDTRKSSIENLIQLVEDVRNFEPAPKRILVCCSNGISDCGLFIAMSFIITKYLKEVEYDIPNAIRSLRRSHIRFMSKSDEFRVLHEAIEIYSQKFDPYNNVDNDPPQTNKSNK